VVIWVKMVCKNESLEWLWAQTAEYRLAKNDTREVVEDFDEVGMLGKGFVAVDDLEENRCWGWDSAGTDLSQR
jgi:hypothetical protein